ncbi:MAG: hypothetical protein QE271_11025 [Bacteriovoracaceae bacterium]|nr:hypothetical protein [Bacteriovoracaceae bacterium]
MNYDQKQPKIKSSHWIFYIHADALQLRPLTQYQMVHKEINSRNEVLFGGGPGFARRFMLAFPLSTITEINAYYWGHDVTEAQKPNTQDLKDYEVLRSEQKDIIYGIQISQSINFAFETKYLLIEPFIQFGVGLGRTKYSLKYRWDTNTPSEYESYQSTISENLVTQSLAAGIQFIAMNGFISYLKVQKNVFTVGTRETSISRIDVGSTEVSTSNTEKLNQNQDEYSYGVAFGYVF